MVLLWTNEPIYNEILNRVCTVELVNGLGIYKDILQDILSLITTIIILITAVIKFKSTKKDK